MRESELGALVVVEGENPVGIVTDRDLLCRVIAAKRDPEAVAARDVMSRPLVSVEAGEPLERIVATMASQRVRRVPIVSADRLVGLVTLDDVLGLLSDEVADVASGVRQRFRQSQRDARTRVLARDLESMRGDLGGQLERLGHEIGETLGQKRRGEGRP